MQFYPGATAQKKTGSLPVGKATYTIDVSCDSLPNYKQCAVSGNLLAAMFFGGLLLVLCCCCTTVFCCVRRSRRSRYAAV